MSDRSWQNQKALGVVESYVKGAESGIIKECEESAKRETKRLIRGEILLFVIVCFIFTILALIISPSVWLGVLSSALGALTWAVVKVWNIKKKFIVPEIERT